MNFILQPGLLRYTDLALLLSESTTLEVDPSAYPAIHAAAALITKVLAENKTVYGINTGFGALASKRIAASQLETLQRSLVLSHAAGTGELLDDKIVRLILALKINSLARGYSGVRLETIHALQTLYNAHIYPCIPSQGSVGASGDLAPLAHLSAALLGEGDVRMHGKIMPAREALAKINQAPLTLAPKEGLALLNGTQVSTAIALVGYMQIENAFISALVSGALSVDAARASDAAFDARIQAIRGHDTQNQVAAWLRQLLEGSQIRAAHLNCDKVQDPYSLRCQPQVMGACLTQLRHAAAALLTEANAVSDNPLVFAEDDVILSGGNFHAAPVAMVADTLALSIAEIGALAERRIALLTDPHFSGLPAFLVNDAGLNSGFMIAHVTAAALASENKALAHPSSIDSIPTSANQEDHVSMATYAARRLLPMAENTATIIAIELLAACQGIDFQRPLKTSKILTAVYEIIRADIPFYQADRFFAPDIAKAKQLVQDGKIANAVKAVLSG